MRKYHLGPTVPNHRYSIHYMLERFQEQQETAHCYNAKDREGSSAVGLTSPPSNPDVSGFTSLAQWRQSLGKRSCSQKLLSPTALCFSWPIWCLCDFWAEPHKLCLEGTGLARASILSPRSLRSLFKSYHWLKLMFVLLVKRM